MVSLQRDGAGSQGKPDPAPFEGPDFLWCPGDIPGPQVVHVQTIHSTSHLGVFPDICSIHVEVTGNQRNVLSLVVPAIEISQFSEFGPPYIHSLFVSGIVLHGHAAASE
jgi:hypothetical protein